REPLNIHGPAKNCINYGSINRFQEFRAIQLPPRTAINLLWLSKLASSVKLHDNSAQGQYHPILWMSWRNRHKHLSDGCAGSRISRTTSSMVPLAFSSLQIGLLKAPPHQIT
ncbi:unnamed protein product, partial [Gulo gulo]